MTKQDETRPTITVDDLRTAIIEALAKPRVMNHNLIVVHMDGSVERVASLTLDDISWSGRRTYAGTLFSFEGIEHDGSRYLYPDGSAITADDEEWIRETINESLSAADDIAF